MPLYTFKCRACQHVHEAIYSSYAISEHAACPNCGGSNLERLPAAGSFTVTGYNAKNGYAKR